MKDVFLKKRAEVDEICKKSHMDMPYQREMDTIMGMIISGASQQSDGIPFLKVWIEISTFHCIECESFGEYPYRRRGPQ